MIEALEDLTEGCVEVLGHGLKIDIAGAGADDAMKRTVVALGGGSSGLAMTAIAAASGAEACYSSASTAEASEAADTAADAVGCFVGCYHQLR